MTLPAGNGALRVSVESTDAKPSAVPQTTTRLDYTAAHFPQAGAIIKPAYTLADGQATLRARMLNSFDATEVDCILAAWAQSFDQAEREIIFRSAQLHVDMLERYTAAFDECIKQ